MGGSRSFKVIDVGTPGKLVMDRQTDRRTDKIPIANTRSQQYLPVQLSRVKTKDLVTNDISKLSAFSAAEFQAHKLVIQTFEFLVEVFWRRGISVSTKL